MHISNFHNIKQTSILLLLMLVTASLQSQQPNMFLYIADDQNTWDYGVHGNTQVDTSAYDNLINEGMVFMNAYTSQAICAPSRSQIFTGLYPMKNGCMANHLPVKNVPDINDYLNALGYEVVLVGKGHIKPNSVFNWTHHFYSTKNRLLPLNKVEAYIQTATKPYCIIFASELPHGPYPAKNSYTNKPLDYDPSSKVSKANVGKYKSGYYQNIEDDNKQLANVISMLKRLSLYDESIFMYLSDHGLKGKWSVSETGLKIPFVVRWPKKIRPASKSNQLVSLVDILPTWIEIAGGVPNAQIDGVSFLALLEGKDNPVRKFAYGIATRQNIQKCYVFPSRSVRDSRYKYIKNFNAFEVYKQNLGNNPSANEFIKNGAMKFKHKPYEELYDLEADPYEKNNLANNNSFKKKKEMLSLELSAWMKSQEDFLITHKMPLIKPTQHPLDRHSKWNKPDARLIGSLTDKDYIPVHY